MLVRPEGTNLVKTMMMTMAMVPGIAQGDCNPYTLAIQPNEPYSLAMPLLIETLVVEINP